MGVDNVKPVATLWVDEGTRIGEHLSAVVVHRQKCHICATRATKAGNTRLCTVGEMHLQKLCAEWVMQGHHRMTEWMVHNCV